MFYIYTFKYKINLEKLSQTFLLKCGFQYQYTELKHLNNFKILNNSLFKLSYWEYDVELDGEIEKEIICFKSWGKWILVCNKKTIQLQYTDDLLNLDLIKYVEYDMKFVYILKSKFGFKIGRTKNVDDRGNIFNVKLPFKWYFDFICGVKHPKKIEKFLHFILKSKNINGEWFNLDESELKNIKQFIFNNSNYFISFNSPLNKESPTLK